MKLLLLFLSLTLLGHSSCNCAQNSIRLEWNSEPLSVGFHEVKTAPVDLEIQVSNQQQFNRISDNILDAVRVGKKHIVVKIRRGKYTYSDKQFFLNLNAPDVSVDIVGKNVFLYPEGINSSGASNHLYSYYHPKSYEYVDFWSSVYRLDSQVEIVDEKSRLCRFRSADLCSILSVGDVIQLSEWYNSQYYNVERIDGEFIYFIASDMVYDKTYKCYNVNYDHGYGSTYPRVRAWRQAVHQAAIEGIASNLVSIKDSKLLSFTMCGLNVMASSCVKFKSLVSFNNVEALQLSVRNCNFENCKSVCVNTINSNNVNCKKCSFKHCYNTCIKADNYSENLVVNNCTFHDNGLNWDNRSQCIMVCGTGFWISDNVIQDFTRDAISVGVWYGDEKVKPVSGVIEKNDISYSMAYFDNYWQHTLMDAGCIYTYTQNDDVLIRYNHIHDFQGMKDYRGIFCDDGTNNVTICGNVITNIKDSYCIDLRAVPVVETALISKTKIANVNNKMFYNLVDGPYRFEGRPNDENNGCAKYANVICSNGMLARSSAKSSNVNYTESDIRFKANRIENGIITLERESYKELKKMQVYNEVKQWIRK